MCRSDQARVGEARQQSTTHALQIYLPKADARELRVIRRPA